MTRSRLSIIAAMFLCSSFFFASCGGEPAGEHLPPETTPGAYLGNDDLDTTETEAATDTATTEYIE